MSGTSPTSNTLSGTSPAPHMKFRLKNTFIDVDEGEQSQVPSMPDLLRAQTTPAVLNALQALYQVSAATSQQQQPMPAWPLHGGMDPVMEQHSFVESDGALDSDDPPPEFNAEEVLRQISELTETLSAITCEDPRASPGSPDSSTTVMLRNIPNKYTASMLLEQFALFGFETKDLDFFYLPIDFRNVCNVGFAFVNFRHHDRAVSFMHTFENYRLPATNSSKICTVCWARVQGYQPNVDHYRDSPIAAEYRPWLFDVNGDREPFPEPDASVAATIEKSALEAQRASNATKGPDENKIFVGGLDKDTGGAELAAYFSKYGLVRDAAVVIDRTSGKSRGFGFCLFERFVPKKVLVDRHVINGIEVAVKMYQEGTAPGAGGAAGERKKRFHNKKY